MNDHTATADVRLDTVLMGFLQTFALTTPDHLSVDALLVALRAGGFAPAWDEVTARDFRIAEDFFLSVEHASKHIRCELDGFDVVLCSKRPLYERSIPFRVILTVYPTLDVAILFAFFQLEGCSADDLILLSQSILGRHALEAKLADNLRNVPSRVITTRSVLPEYVVRTRSCFQSWEQRWEPATKYRGGHTLIGARIVEVRPSGSGGKAVALELLTSHPREAYGILAMDEGWRHVPRNFAVARLGAPWQTREHVCVVTFECAVLMIDCQYSEGSEYVRSQQNVRDNYGVRCEEYFTFKPQVPGLNHGPLLALETCAMRASFLTDIYRVIRKDQPRSLRTLLNMRSTLQDKLARFERFSLIQEISALEKRMFDSMGHSDAAENIERILARIESELNIRYTQRVNRMMGVLTVLGLIWTIIGSIAALVSLSPDVPFLFGK